MSPSLNVDHMKMESHHDPTDIITAWIFSPLIDFSEMVPIAKDFGWEFLD
jgi:hypothetical protein